MKGTEKKVTARKASKKSKAVKSAGASRKTTVRRATKNAVRAAPLPRAMNAPRADVFPYGMKRHNELAWHLAQFQRVVKKCGADSAETLQKALAFAKEKHERQTRKDGAPFIIHPVRIANIVGLEWGMAEESMIIAALLHDVIEDTQTTIREVKDGFGEKVGKLVDGLTMWPGSETPEVYLKRVARGPREIRIVKCADVIDNLRSWNECAETTEDRFSRWWRQANEYALPMADETTARGAETIRLILDDPWYLKRAQMV